MSRLNLSEIRLLTHYLTPHSIADFIGLRLMSKACFDPREAPQYVNLFSRTSTVSLRLPTLVSFLLQNVGPHGVERHQINIGLQGCRQPRLHEHAPGQPEAYQGASLFAFSPCPSRTARADQSFLGRQALDSWLPEALTLRASSSCADTSRQFEGFQASQVGQWGVEKLGGGRMGW